MASGGTPITKQVSYDGVDYDIVREGLAEILNPRTTQAISNGDKAKSQPQSVFYNPIQQFNRDLSVLAIRVFAEQLVTLRSQKQGRRKPGHERANKRRKLEETNGSKKPEEQTYPVATDGNDFHDDSIELLQAELDNDLSVEDVEAPTTRRDEPTESANPIAGVTEISSIPVQPTQQAQRPAIRVLDALSASGLRALRYAQEISALTHVVANDLSAAATKAIGINIKHNKQSDKINLNTGDAIEYMHKSKNKFEVVDLDPYGTAGPFLDAAIQALTNGGLLCVTCTDSAVFASAGYCEKTYALYGGLPIKGPHSHEGGLRLLLHAIASSAARYGLAIEPLLSLSIDFYIRVFVKIRRSALEVKFLAGKTMIVYGCDSGCGSWSTQPLARIKESTAKNGTRNFQFSLAQAPSASPNCPHCGFVTHLHGPMWAGPIHNPYFVQSMLNTLETLSTDTYGTKPRMEGMLITARDEVLLSISSPTEISAESRIPPHIVDHHPFFFLPAVISGILHCVAPSAAQMRGALLRLGYRVVRSHAKPGSLKTDAPWTIIWEIMREWIRQERPVKEESIKSGSAAHLILSKRRDKRDNLSSIRQELKTLSEDTTTNNKGTIKTSLESILFRLSHESEGMPDINGEEENGPAATEKNMPLHKLKVVFDEQLGKKSEESQGKKLVRYQVNPRANWGPMARAKPSGPGERKRKADDVEE